MSNLIKDVGRTSHSHSQEEQERHDAVDEIHKTPTWCPEALVAATLQRVCPRVGVKNIVYIIHAGVHVSTIYPPPISLSRARNYF